MRSTVRCRRGGFTLVELLVVIGLILTLIAILLPAARRSVEAGRQVVCLDHLRQIAHATLMYCQDNDGNFPGVSGVEPPTGPLAYEWVYWESGASAPFNDPANSPVMRYLSSHSLAGGTTDPMRADFNVLRCPSDDPQSHFQVSHQTFGTYPFSYAINIFTAQWPTNPPAGKPWRKDTYVSFNGHTYNMVPAFRISEVKNPSQVIFFVEGDPQHIDDGNFMDMTFLDYPVSGGPLSGQGWSEPVSFVHDTSGRGAYTPWDPSKPAGYATAALDHPRRTNVAFCDGHGEFVTQRFLEARSHYDPKYDLKNDTSNMGSN